MGRPPCGTGEGMKKGPWSPEEDIVLASYVQKHGAGNWPSVPRNAGLRRWSQSCRLRWTNYLRPGIKRGDFTPEDDSMIIELRKLFGNSWSSIANYLPGRTNSDIKNYWNHKLKKKIQNVDESEGSNVNDATTSSKKRLWATRLQNDIEYVKNALSKALSSASPAAADATTSTTCAAPAPAPAVSNLPLETVVASSRPPPVSSAGLVNFQPSSPNYNNKQALQEVISDAQTSSSYPCSVENIARLLKEWTRETDESQRKGDDQFNVSNVHKDDDNANANATNEQGMMNKVDKDDDDDNANKVHYYNYNTVNNNSPPVPLALAAPVPFPPTMSAVVPLPPPAIVSPATAPAPAPAPAPMPPLDGDDLEKDDNLHELRMSIPYDQNVFWPFLY